MDECHLCGATYTLLFCWRDLKYTCDVCYRADFDHKKKGCGSCKHKDKCEMLDEYSDYFDVADPYTGV